jgi:2-alkyl-3-oxoalkanoate reductase
MIQPSGIRRVKIAIAGAGYVSSKHAAALATLDFVELVAVIDPNRESAARLATRYSIATVLSSIADLVEGTVDCVYVLTPPATHCALTLAAIDKGCHVFVEKPLAETADESQRMIEAARARGVIISVNHSDLFDPSVKSALSLVRSGSIGTVLSVDILRSSEYGSYAGGPLPGLITKGSYPFQDLGVHALYQLEAFLGPIRSIDVRFSGTGSNPNLRFDEWFVHAQCERGVGRIHLSWNARPMRNRIEINATRGSIQIDKFLQTLVVGHNYPGPKFIGLVIDGIRNSIGTCFAVIASVFRFATGRLKPSPGIFDSAIAFATAIRDGVAPPVDIEDGARIVALIEPPSAEADTQWNAERAQRLAPLAPADVLVTGADGFLGRALVNRLLESNLRVRVLGRRASGPWTKDARVQAVVGDLGDPQSVDHAVNGVRVIFHVGAAMRGSADDYQAGTIWGTRNVLSACERFSAERLVYVSSMSVFDHAGVDRSKDVVEESSLEPKPQLRGLYTQTKLAAENMVRAAIDAGKVKAVIIRPGQIFGPGTERVTPNGVIGFGSHWVVVGSGRRTLPLVHIDDVIDALLLSAQNEAAVGQTLNIVDRVRVTQNQYLEMVGVKSLGIKVIRIPNFIMLGLSAMVEVLGRLVRREMPLSRYRIRSIRPLPPMDMSRAERLGWKPRVGVMAGLSRMSKR